MVVLEGGGGVVTIGNNQYLQPDYLAPLPTTVSIDKKKDWKKEESRISTFFNIKRKNNSLETSF